MKDTDSMTMQDVLEMMKCIREFFTVVRLESGYDTMDSEETYCEIEYLKEDIFFVKAKRIEIDGKPYVIKIKQEVADVRLPEETGQEPLCFIYEGTAGRSLDIQVPILGSFSAIVVRHLQASAFSILMIISMLGLGIVAVSIFLYTRHRQLVEKRFVNVAVF